MRKALVVVLAIMLAGAMSVAAAEPLTLSGKVTVTFNDDGTSPSLGLNNVTVGSSGDGYEFSVEVGGLLRPGDSAEVDDIGGLTFGKFMIKGFDDVATVTAWGKDYELSEKKSMMEWIASGATPSGAKVRLETEVAGLGLTTDYDGDTFVLVEKAMGDITAKAAAKNEDVEVGVQVTSGSLTAKGGFGMDTGAEEDNTVFGGEVSMDMESFDVSAGLTKGAANAPNTDDKMWGQVGTVMGDLDTSLKVTLDQANDNTIFESTTVYGTPAKLYIKYDKDGLQDSYAIVRADGTVSFDDLKDKWESDGKWKSLTGPAAVVTFSNTDALKYTILAGAPVVKDTVWAYGKYADSGDMKASAYAKFSLTDKLTAEPAVTADMPGEGEMTLTGESKFSYAFADGLTSFIMVSKDLTDAGSDLSVSGEVSYEF